MAHINHLFLRGAVWTWRRRIPPLSTRIEHMQLSLRTKSFPIARILANRLNFESDRMIHAMQTGGLTANEGKIYLASVIREERARIESLRIITHADPTTGDDESDQRHDWATAVAWKTLSTRGLDARLTQDDVDDLMAKGASGAAIHTLIDQLGLLAMHLTSPGGTGSMVRRAKHVLELEFGPDHSLSASVPALAVLQLRKLLMSGRAKAWEEAGTENPHCDDAAPLADQLDQKLNLTANIPPQPAAPRLPASPNASIQKFDVDPNLMALAQRVNTSKARVNCKPDTQKQILSTAALFVKATGITDVSDVEQRHLNYFVKVLSELPQSYGKSAKDAARSIDEILMLAKALPDEKVGLSPRTVNGHLDRMNLLLTTAQSEGLSISATLKINLLRVPETQRARDKRDPFEPHQIARIFTHPIWTGCKNPRRRHQPGTLVQKDAFYWGPILAAYTGARREELLGLAPDDIMSIDGIPCINIRANANRGLKSEAAKRIIPLHEHLLELGFLEFSATRQATNGRALFPELVPTNTSDSFGDKFFYTWDRVLDLQLGEDGAGMSFHCWRHYVIAFLKTDTSVTDKERRDLAGHVGGNVHDEVYDKPSSPRAMRRVVNLLPRVF